MWSWLRLQNGAATRAARLRAAAGVAVVAAAAFAAIAASGSGARDTGARPLRDRVPPTTPVVRGPRRATTAQPVYRFSAKDGGTPAARIRFRCAFDSTRLHRCGARYSERLTVATHLLRVQALDLAGNRSRINAVRVVVVPQQPSAGTTVVAAGDIACDPGSSSFNGGRGSGESCRQLATSDLVLELAPDAVLTLGDNQYENGEYNEFLQSFDPSWGRFKSLIRPSVGNHEYQTSDAAGYCRYFGPAARCDHGAYYSYDLGSWHLIALNSECSRVGGCGRGSAQESWLRADLADHDNPCTLAYWHRPRWTSGRHSSAIEMTAIWNDLVGARADVVLTGHNHGYERFAPLDQEGQPSFDGVRYFVVGTGGGSHYAFDAPPRAGEEARGTPFGVLQLTLAERRYTWRFVSIPGTTFTDSGSGTCH